MAVIEAYKRTKSYTYTVPGKKPLVFHPNHLGHVTCDVEDLDLVKILLDVPTGFRVYVPHIAEAEAALSAEKPTMSPVLTAAPPPAGQVEAHRFVIVSGEASLDLRPMSDDDLRAFAKANGITIHHKKTGDAIREAIVAGLAE